MLLQVVRSTLSMSTGGLNRASLFFVLHLPQLCSSWANVHVPFGGSVMSNCQL